MQCGTDADCLQDQTGAQQYVCRDSFCVPEPTWSCLGGDPPAATLTTDNRPLSLELRNLPTQQPMAGVRAQLCSLADPDCEAPRSETVTSDDDGRVELTPEEGPAMDFEGFVLLSGDDLMPARYFITVSSTSTDAPIQLLSSRDANLLASHLGLPLDPQRGIALLSAVDCQSAPGTGVTLSSDKADDLSRLFYVIDGLPVAADAASSTDRSGHAGVFNAPAGTLVVSAQLEKDDRRVRTMGVRVVPGAITYSRVGPHGM